MPSVLSVSFNFFFRATRERSHSRQPLQNLKAWALAEKSAQSVHDLGKSAVGFTRNNLVGTELVKHLVGDVAQIERVQHSHAEIDGEFQSRLARLGLEPIVLRKQQDAKPSKSSVLQRHPVLGFVHPEAARPARPRSEEDVVVQDLLPAKPACFQPAQILDQIAHREICGIALCRVPEFPTQVIGGKIRIGQDFAAVAAPVKNRLDKFLVLPGEPAEEDGDPLALLPGEEPLLRAAEVPHRRLRQAGRLL